MGARVVDVYGIISDKAEIDNKIGAVNGTLLSAMDEDGNYFGVMNDFFGHAHSLSLQHLVHLPILRPVSMGHCADLSQMTLTSF